MSSVVSQKTKALLLCDVFIIASSGLTPLAAQRRSRPGQPAPAKAKPKPPAARVPEAEVTLERLPPDPSVESADIAITANVRASSLIFEAVPNPSVTFPNNQPSDTVWEAKRDNLPTPVEPGVTYRNIGIRLKITSVFRDIDRIVAEALGEVPISNDAVPAAVEAPKKPATQQSPPSAPVRPRSPKK